MIGLFDRLARPLLRVLDPEDAHRLAVRIDHQEASIERFLELADPQPDV